MLFQERLRKYRKEAGYKSAKDFADEMGIPYPSYMAYENKKREPKYDVLMKMADKLGVAIDELLGYEQKQATVEQADFDKKAIGERIKEYRVARGLTQSDLANKANITRIALGNYERGQRIPTIDIFARIAMALNVSIDELMGYRPEQSSIWQHGMAELIGHRPNQLSPLQQIKRDFEKAGYKVNEEGEPCDSYEIATPGEKYPFRVETQDDLKQIYHQIKLDVMHAQKKVWKDNIYKSLLKYERRKYHEKEKYFMFLQKKEQSK